MKPGALIGGGSKKGKKHKNNKKFFLPFLLFLLFLPHEGILYSEAAETKRNAESEQKLPLIYWAEGIETAESLKRAGVEQIAAPTDKAEAWRKAGFKVVAVSPAEFERREKLLTPRIAGRANVASATRRPWVDANGWRFIRNPAGN